LTGLVGVVPLDEGDGEDDLRSIFNEAADVRRPPTPLSEGVEESLRGLAAKDGAASSLVGVLGAAASTLVLEPLLPGRTIGSSLLTLPRLLLLVVLGGQQSFGNFLLFRLSRLTLPASESTLCFLASAATTSILMDVRLVSAAEAGLFFVGSDTDGVDGFLSSAGWLIFLSSACDLSSSGLLFTTRAAETLLT
jgi:hypothetical protein